MRSIAPGFILAEKSTLNQRVAAGARPWAQRLASICV